MDIYEAMELFRSPQKVQSRFSSPQEIAQSHNEWELRQKAEKLLESFETYRSMTVQEGQTIATAALNLYDAGIPDDRFQYLPQIVLMNVGKLVPGALAGLYEDIIERNLFWGGGVTFWRADPTTRDKLLAFLELDKLKSSERDDILDALAWIDDEVVHHLFHWWQQHTPSWYPTSHFPINNHSLYAGWEITAASQHRYLYHHACYALVPIDKTEDIHTSGSVQVFRPMKEQCHWCGRPLIALFDCDLRDPRLTFLDARRKRLCIPLCVNCSLQGEHIFMDVDSEGHARWSTFQQEHPRILDLNLYRNDEPVAERHLIVGPARNPVETVAQYWDEGLSQLGGHPEWVQYPEYPCCPTCKHTMLCIGQLGLTDMQPGTEGMIYAFFCSDCGKATTGYQQT